MSHRGTGKLFNRVVTETSARLATVEEQLHGCAVRVQKQRSSLRHHNTYILENTQLNLRFNPLTCSLLHKCPFLWKKAEKKQISIHKLNHLNPTWRSVKPLTICDSHIALRGRKTFQRLAGKCHVVTEKLESQPTKKKENDM